MSSQSKAQSFGKEVGEKSKPKQSSTTVKAESDNLQQRRLQRKKLKRYEVDSSDEESEASNNGREESKAKESKPQLTHLTAIKVDITDGSNNGKASSILPINAEAISEVANQSLNGELSLLQTYEKKGVMNEVFGSQSVLSQELQAANFSQQSVKFPGSPGVFSRLKQDPDNTDTNAQTRQRQQPTSSEDEEMKVPEDNDNGNDNDNDVSSSNPPSSASASTSKLEANGESLSQASFVFNPNSLPILSVSETQLVSDTIQNDHVQLSQMSTLSGYDMIIGAAQALAERDGEDSPFEGSESVSKLKETTDEESPPSPPMPKLPVSVACGDGGKSKLKLAAHRMNNLQDSSCGSTPTKPTTKKGRGNLKVFTDDDDDDDNDQKEHGITKKKEGNPKSHKNDGRKNASTSPTQLKKRARPATSADTLVEESPKKISRQAKSPKGSPRTKSPVSAGASATAASGASTSSAAKPGFIQTNGTTYTVRRTKAQRKKMEEETNYIAKRAAELVEQLRVNRKVEKQLLLSMALTRENPRTGPSSFPAEGTLILNGFYWGQFPPLEKVLRSYMEEYYELSIEKCQSRTQQAFNNKLVTLIKSEAAKYGWSFDKGAFDEKKIRDRIRCFFKTHIQNAKKRLKTMVRNPLKRANAKALAAHLDLIEKCDLIDKIDDEKDDETPSTEALEPAKEESKMPSLPSSYDSDAHDAAQVLALGFSRMAKDEKVMQCL